MKLRYFAAMLSICLLPMQAFSEPMHVKYMAAQEATTPSTIKKLPEETKGSAEQAPMDTSAEQAKAQADEIVPGPLRRIVIDPGHGGTNEGAIGVAKIHEKHLTLQIALLLADRLRKAMPDTEIILTRQRDQALSLGERIDIANRAKADLFLSLHFNSSNNPEAIGFESFWVGQFWESDMRRDGVEITDEIRAQRERAGALGERMAQSFNRAMRHRFTVLDRGVKPGDYTVLTRAEVPAVVIEMGFLSHADEGISLTTSPHRAKLVDALFDAVVHYAN